MKKVHSYLKGLAETRARAAGEVEKNAALLAALSEDAAQIRHALARAEGSCQAVRGRLGQAQAELASCDLLISRYDERIDPSQIEPIRAWRGRYGKRGALQKFVEDVFKAACPEPLSTQNIASMAIAEFGLTFATPEERYFWQKNTLRGKLKVMVQRGLLERLPSATIGEVARWRWIGTVGPFSGRVARRTSGKG